MIYARICSSIRARGTGLHASGATAVNFRCTALQGGANRGAYRIALDILLEAGAGVNAPVSGFGCTALQAAGSGGYHIALDMLLKTSADVNAPPAGSFGCTALQTVVNGS
jgi:hypothetical protein